MKVEAGVGIIFIGVVATAVGWLVSTSALSALGLLMMAVGAAAVVAACVLERREGRAEPGADQSW